MVDFSESCLTLVNHGWLLYVLLIPKLINILNIMICAKSIKRIINTTICIMSTSHWVMCQYDIIEILKHDYDEDECNIKSLINMNIINIMVCGCMNIECHIGDITLDENRMQHNPW